MSKPTVQKVYSNEDLIPGGLEIEDKKLSDQIWRIVQPLQFTREIVERIRKVFEDEMEKGIKGEPSSLQMENTYVPELPDGKEEGKYLALDLGGTNFRVLLVEFQNGKVISEKVQNHQVSEDLRLGPGENLFNFLADCVYDFVKQQNIWGKEVPLGFTFSFPMVQHSLRSGVLVTWTKTFNCPNVVDIDVVKLLNTALDKRGCHFVQVHAVLNDTTGTLLMGAMLDRKTSIGLILGTGSNACYLEKAEQVKHWETERRGEKEVIIDIEWGAFGDNGILDFIKTEFDEEVDQNSLLTHSFTFEKYIAGKYLGEVVRVVLTKLIRNKLLFTQAEQHELKLLNTSGELTSEMVSKIEMDKNKGSTSEGTSSVLEKFGITNYTKTDIEIVQFVCRIASNRSSLLVSICLAALLDRMEKEEATIAIDGSLCEKHPHYREHMEKYLGLFTNKKFKLQQVSDGSGKGAAVAAAIATKLEKRFKRGGSI